MLVLPLFLFVLVWYLVVCYKWKKNIFDHIEKIPGLKWYPLFGTSYTYLGTTRESVVYKFLENVMTYQPISRTWSSGLGEIHLTNPDHLQVVLRSSSHTTKGPFYKFLFPWLGEGLFISEGAKWFMQRKLLTPTFHFKVLDGFLDIFAEKATLLTEKLRAKADGDFFNITKDVAQCTLGVICETSMGVPVEAITDKPLEYVQNVHDFTELAMWRYWRPYIKDLLFYILPQGRRYKKLAKELHAFSEKVIDYKRKQYADKRLNGVQEEDCDVEKKMRTSFMDLLMENENKMSDSDLKALVNTFLAAGFETTSNTISWTLFLLGNYPELQERVHEEIKTVLKDKPAPTTMEELNQLRYVECAIKEAMRLYPVLPFVTREITEEVQIDDYKIPPGTQAILHLFVTHRHPEHFPEPNQYNPDRFLPENSKERHPFSYLPFSAGPRNCLGMRFALLELKSTIATIINKYKVTSLETPEELKVFAHVMIRSQSGINVKLETR